MEKKIEAGTHNKHKISFSQQAQDVIRISDIVLETIDARFIQQSRIPELEKIIKESGKILVHVITKIDLVDLEKLKIEVALSNLSFPAFISATKRIGIAKLRERIHILAKKIKSHAKVHVGIIGYPNTGKSSLINILARRGSTRPSSQAGSTKGIQKVRFAKEITLLDTPGVIRGNENLFRDKDAKKHGLFGVRDPTSIKNPELIVLEIMKLNPGKLERHYGFKASEDGESLIEFLGRKWNFLKKGGLVDEDRVTREILKHWHAGKIS